MRRFLLAGAALVLAASLTSGAGARPSVARVDVSTPTGGPVLTGLEQVLTKYKAAGKLKSKKLRKGKLVQAKRELTRLHLSLFGASSEQTYSGSPASLELGGGLNAATINVIDKWVQASQHLDAKLIGSYSAKNLSFAERGLSTGISLTMRIENGSNFGWMPQYAPSVAPGASDFTVSGGTQTIGEVDFFFGQPLSASSRWVIIGPGGSASGPCAIFRTGGLRCPLSPATLTQNERFLVEVVPARGPSEMGRIDMHFLTGTESHYPVSY